MSNQQRIQVLQMLSDGLGFQQVADRMGLKFPQVRYIVRKSYRDFRVKNVPHLVAHALREGMIK